MTIRVEKNFNLNIGGYGFSSQQPIVAATPQATEVSEGGANPLTMAKTGTLTTRTDDDTGVITAQAGHGIADADVIDVYWAGGVRYGMVADVTGDAVSIEGGAGNVLPADETAVTLCKVTTIDGAWADVDGDEIEAMFAIMPVRGHVAFQEPDGTVIVAAELLGGIAYEYIAGMPGGSNPFAGVDVGKVVVSAGVVSTGNAYCRVGCLYG